MIDLGTYENKIFRVFLENVSANCCRCSQETQEKKETKGVYSCFLAKRSTQAPSPLLFREVNSILLLFR